MIDVYKSKVKTTYIHASINHTDLPISQTTAEEHYE